MAPRQDKGKSLLTYDKYYASVPETLGYLEAVRNRNTEVI